MNQYEVKITRDAQQDMRALYDYIAHVLKSPEHAIRQYDRLADAILHLDMLPARHALVGFEPERSQGIRRMPVDNYSVFYRVEGNQVIVIGVLYSASDCTARLHAKGL